MPSRSHPSATKCYMMGGGTCQWITLQTNGTTIGCKMHCYLNKLPWLQPGMTYALIYWNVCMKWVYIILIDGITSLKCTNFLKGLTSALGEHFGVLEWNLYSVANSIQIKWQPVQNEDSTEEIAEDSTVSLQRRKNGENFTSVSISST